MATPAKKHARLRFPLRVAAVVAGAFYFAGMALAQDWPCYAHDPQHQADSAVASQAQAMVHWSAPVDLNQHLTGSDLYIHYGSPVITGSNTVIVPVKTGATDGFEAVAYSYNAPANSLSQVWTLATDYSVPSCSWIPICGITLTPGDGAVVVPAAGGTVLWRSAPDSANGVATRLAFYGIANYNANPAAFNSAIKICTPIASDASGNLYFGYISTGGALPGYPGGIPSGLARISSGGAGTYVAASAISGDATTQSVLYNCQPAISADGSTLYIGVSNIPPSSPNSYGTGYLCALNSITLARTASVALQDPRAGAGAASLTNYSSATPTVGPDGDVYFGVNEANIPSNNARGWMLHFSANLGTVKLPGAFGWDSTPSVVPAAAVTSYTGTSSYLILTKYNNYAGVGTGDGVNRMAVLDPNTGMADSVTNATVMNTVLTVTGTTSTNNRHSPNAVSEWCVNTAAVDPAGKCAVVNSEDGNLYRWDFTTNTLSPGLALATPTGESYTPTAIGPDGAVYAINDSVLYSVGVTAQQIPAMPRWAAVLLALMLPAIAGPLLARRRQ